MTDHLGRFIDKLIPYKSLFKFDGETITLFCIFLRLFAHKTERVEKNFGKLHCKR
ncbi:MAG: hypothetical protein JRJ49_00895 [Deltaproteobacteria bacterium]|nr:hypothetical protein [Deltaproteobacteria bacterium]